VASGVRYGTDGFVSIEFLGRWTPQNDALCNPAELYFVTFVREVEDDAERVDFSSFSTGGPIKPGIDVF
jgi:hypothetical protein